MTEQPTGSEHAPEFDFVALGQSKNYRRALINELPPHIHRNMLKVGADIGQITAELVCCPSVRELVLVEPDAQFYPVLRDQSLKLAIVNGTIQIVPLDDNLDCTISVSVLEPAEN